MIYFLKHLETLSLLDIQMTILPTPILQRKEVKGNVNSPRTYYFNKLKKSSDSKKGGAGLDETYRSK